LERPQVEALVRRLAGGKRLPEEVVAHIVGKTDGVPLYVEELTKMLLTSDLLREDAEQYVLTGPLLSVAIPDTLQDSLMARLDQMQTAKEVAQLGSVLGREFAYDMLQALYWQDKETLQAALAQADTGLSLLTEARTIMDQNGQRFVDAEYHRLEGELRLHQTEPDASQAARYFQQALDIARQQQARALELRAAMSLARLWQQQDKRQDAYDLLTPVYEWFTEGFDTADLKEAKVLLDELEK
jgi:predicted ATPase